VDPVDDLSNLIVAYISSLLQDTLFSGSSSAHVTVDDALVNGSVGPHVTDALDSLTPLFSDDGDYLHDLPILVALPSNRSRPIPKWAISFLLIQQSFLLVHTCAISRGISSTSSPCSNRCLFSKQI
jgi:hypothetical protein